MSEYAGKEYRKWEQQKRLIPVMIRMYCHGTHHTRGKAVCEDCRALTDYALYRLEKCPFKKDKSFCSCCRVHCYRPDMRAKIKAVMKYSGPRMLFSHPFFAISHVVQVIKFKKQQERPA